MRLIDADTLRNKCDEYDWDTIDNEPTVDAIPIEWMKNWFNEKLKDGRMPKNFEIIYDWLIYDWEKENNRYKKITVTREQINADNEFMRLLRESIEKVIANIVNQYREEEENEAN